MLHSEYIFDSRTLGLGVLASGEFEDTKYGVPRAQELVITVPVRRRRQGGQTRRIVKEKTMRIDNEEGQGGHIRASFRMIEIWRDQVPGTSYHSTLGEEEKLRTTDEEDSQGGQTRRTDKEDREGRRLGMIEFLSTHCIRLKPSQYHRTDRRAVPLSLHQQACKLGHRCSP